MSLPVLAAANWTNRALTMWGITLGMAVVVAGATVVLLLFLTWAVYEVRAGVNEAAAAVAAVAGNTSHLSDLLTINDTVVDLKDEALRHATLVEVQ